MTQWADCPGCPKCEPNGGYVLRRGQWRATVAHSYVYVFSKTSSYYGDGEAVRMANSPHTHGGRNPSAYSYVDEGLVSESTGLRAPERDNGANLRSVLDIGPEPFTLELCAACRHVYKARAYGRLERRRGAKQCRCADSDDGIGPQWVAVPIAAEYELLGQTLAATEYGWQCGDCGEVYTQEEWEDLPTTSVVVCRCGASEWVSHYATYPTKLPELFIRAFTSEAGCCPQCGAPWARVIEPMKTDARGYSHHDDAMAYGSRMTGIPTEGYEPGKTIGWRPTCTCRGRLAAASLPATEAPGVVHSDYSTVPAVVLDPFAGTGSTLIAAKRNGRRYLGIDCSQDYLDLAAARLAETPAALR